MLLLSSIRLFCFSITRRFIPRRQKATSHIPCSLKPKLKLSHTTSCSTAYPLNEASAYRSVCIPLHSRGGAGFWVFCYFEVSCACREHIVCHLDMLEHRGAPSRTRQGQPKQIWFPQDRLGPRSLNEICLTKASAKVTMVQFFFWKLAQLTDQLHSTGEIKRCGVGRGFTAFKSQIKNPQPKGHTASRKQSKGN